MAKEKKPQFNNQALLLSVLFLVVGLLMGYIYATNTNSDKVEDLRAQMQSEIDSLQQQLAIPEVEEAL